MIKKLFLMLSLNALPLLTYTFDFTREEIAAITVPWHQSFMPRMAEAPEFLLLSPLAGSYGLLNNIHRGIIEDPLQLRSIYDPEGLIYKNITEYFFYLQDTSAHATQSVEAPANLLVQKGLFGPFVFNCLNSMPLEDFYDEAYKNALRRQYFINKYGIDDEDIIHRLIAVSSEYVGLQQELDSVSRLSPTKSVSRDEIKAQKSSVEDRIDALRQDIHIDEKIVKKPLDLVRDAEKFIKKTIPAFYSDLQTCAAHESNTLYPRGITQLIISMYLVQRAHDIGNPALIRHYTSFFAESAPAAYAESDVMPLDPRYIEPADTVLPPRQPYASVKGNRNNYIKYILCVEKSLIDLFNIFLYNPITGNFNLAGIPDAAMPEFKEIYRRINEQLEATDKSRDHLIMILESEEILDLWGRLFAQKDPIFYRKKAEQLDVAAGTNNIFTLIRLILGQEPHPTSNTTRPERQPKKPWSLTEEWSAQAIADEINSIIRLFGTEIVRPVESRDITRELIGLETPDAKIRARIKLNSIDGAQIIWQINSGHSEVRVEKPIEKRLLSSFASSSSSSSVTSRINPLAELNQTCSLVSHFNSLDAAKLYPLSCLAGDLDHIDNGLCLFSNHNYQEINVLYTRLLNESLEAGDYYQLLTMVNFDSPFVENFFSTLSHKGEDYRMAIWAKIDAALHRLKNEPVVMIPRLEGTIRVLEEYLETLHSSERRLAKDLSRTEFMRTPSPAAVIDGEHAAAREASPSSLSEATLPSVASSSQINSVPVRQHFMPPHEPDDVDIQDEV
jgi:hypothetical protein